MVGSARRTCAPKGCVCITSLVLTGNVAALGGGLFVERVQGIANTPDASRNLFFENVPDAADSNGSWHLPSSNLGTRSPAGRRLPVRGVRYYLVTAEDAFEGSRGLRSDGTPRPTSPSCGGP